MLLSSLKRDGPSARLASGGEGQDLKVYVRCLIEETTNVMQVGSASHSQIGYSE